MMGMLSQSSQSNPEKPAGPGLLPAAPWEAPATAQPSATAPLATCAALPHKDLTCSGLAKWGVSRW